MKTSARNAFPGTIRSVTQGPLAAQVTIACGPHDIVASMTTAAAARIGVQPGASAVAFVNASDVVLVTDFAGYRLSAHNQLAGRIVRVEKGAVSALVGLALGDGPGLVATVTNDAVDALGLAVGQSATATFPTTAVMVAIVA